MQRECKEQLDGHLATEMCANFELAANSVLKWIQKSANSIVHPCLEARLDRFGGLGLFVRNDCGAIISAGTPLFEIPRACMLECPPGPNKNAALAMELLQQRSAGDASPWACYIKCLPTAEAMQHIPLLWHLQELYAEKCIACPTGPTTTVTTVQRLLSASPSASQLFEILLEQILSEYEQLSVLEQAQLADEPNASAWAVLTDNSVPPHPALPTMLEYAWARCIVASRAIHLWAGPTLVPMADFLNHSRPPNVMCLCMTEELPGGARARGARQLSIYSPPPSTDDEESSDEGSHCSSDTSEAGECDSAASREGAARGSAPTQLTPPLAGVNGQDGERAGPRQVFHCEALRDLAAGEEALWVYNSHSHDAGWLLGYGFVPEDGTSSPATINFGMQSVADPGEPGGEAGDRSCPAGLTAGPSRDEGDPGCLESASGLCTGGTQPEGGQASLLDGSVGPASALERHGRAALPGSNTCGSAVEDQDGVCRGSSVATETLLLRIDAALDLAIELGVQGRAFGIMGLLRRERDAIVQAGSGSSIDDSDAFLLHTGTSIHRPVS